MHSVYILPVDNFHWVVRVMHTLLKLVHIEAQVKGFEVFGFVSIISGKKRLVFWKVGNESSLGVYG